MRKFYDQVVGHIRVVESMGEKFSSETLAPILVPLIIDKLPKGVVEKWELEIGDHKEDYVKVKTLFVFSEHLIRDKESSQPPSLGLHDLFIFRGFQMTSPKCKLRNYRFY